MSKPKHIGEHLSEWFRQMVARADGVDLDDDGNLIFDESKTLNKTNDSLDSFFKSGKYYNRKNK